MSETVQSESDARTANNAMRHQYRVLSDAEKARMVAIKDLGQKFLDEIEALGVSHELWVARVKVEEAVMWTVKHITA